MSNPNTFVAIQVTDPAGISILLATARCDSKGDFSKIFTLSKDSRWGNYTVSVASAGQIATVIFQLLFSGIVSVDKARYTAFETVTVTVVDQEKSGSLNVKATSQADPEGIYVELRETGMQTHVFAGSFSLTESF
jgi:hypothetical protein